MLSRREMQTSKCITYFMSGEIKEFKKKKKEYVGQLFGIHGGQRL